jgi:lysophospholipase L1-like esterase
MFAADETMKTILCFGDSNTWGCVPLTEFGRTRRFGPGVRWPGVLRRELGDGYVVVEEGLNGRTTVFDDPIEPHRNGRDYLVPCLLTHRPIDLVVLMLGTNDLKHRFGLGPADIAAGAQSLIGLIGASDARRDNGPPRTLLVCPPPLGRLTLLADEFDGSTEKSQRLAQHYDQVAAAAGCAFLDAGTLIRSSDVDGIHLDAEEHQKLAVAVAERVRALLS